MFQLCNNINAIVSEAKRKAYRSNFYAVLTP